MAANDPLIANEPLSATTSYISINKPYQRQHHMSVNSSTAADKERTLYAPAFFMDEISIQN
jgi:hypothetical protein